MWNTFFLTEKLPVRSLVAPYDVGQHSGCRFSFVEDHISDQNFLADTGAEVSVLPPSSLDRRRKHAESLLQAANGSTKNNFGLHFLTVDMIILID